MNAITRRWVLILAAMTVSGWTGIGMALMLGISTEQLTRESDAVVQGEVTEKTSHWSDDGRTILTTVRIVPAEVVRGRLDGQELVLEYEGGEVGDVGLKVSDSVSFEQGEHVLVFVRMKSKGLHEVVGRAQGKYTLRQGLARKGGFSVHGPRDMVDDEIDVTVLKERIKRIQ